MGHSQVLDLAKVVEGPVGQVADAVPAETQGLQRLQTLETEALNRSDSVFVQFSEGKNR